jgi:uroporphyrinogen decarboxylase
MTSKERVLAFFAHEEPDRIPIDYSANPGIDRRLKAHFGLAEDDDEGLRCVLGVDFRGVSAPYVGPRLHPAASQSGFQVSPDWGMHNRYIEHGAGAYWEPWGEPLRGITEAEAVAYPMPSPDDFDYEVVTEHCERFKDYAVSAHAGFEVMNWTGRFFGQEAMYIGLATGDPAVMTFIQRYVEIKYEILRRTLEAANGGIDFVWIGEDLGTQRGPRISRKMFHQRIRPIHERFIALAKAHNLPVMMHACGSSSWAFDDLIELGVDAMDTLQPEATDMAPAYLKQTFGDRLVFHGCISTAGSVSFGTVNDVVENVRTTLEIMMPGGGYALAPTHQLQDNSPTGNVLALYEATHRYGRY